MKVMLLNGSPHPAGCVFTALSEIGRALSQNGVDFQMFQLGNGPVRGCIACRHCADGNGCVFKDPLYDSFISAMDGCDGIVIGSPVYYAGPNGSLCAFLDRVFFSAGRVLKGKPAACAVNCRRGGASAAFDRLNKYFTILQMPVVASQYWNSTHGQTPEETRQDLEGMQTMRLLGTNMAVMLKSLAAARAPRPAEEPHAWTSFIR